jgi:23S rRNA pseudouridine1911/1915/1917 synthase
VSAPGDGPTLRFVVGEEEAGGRLDQALSSLAGIARAQARRWIDEDRVCLDDAPARASRRVDAGQVVLARPPEPVETGLVAEARTLDVLHEDADVIVLDKPAGLVVHPAPGHPRGTLVNALLHHCRDLSGIGGVLRPGIVHRLDRGTSGVMVAAKHDAAHAHLARQFHDHGVERVYHAWVAGTPRADAGRVDRPVGRHPRDRKKMSVASRSGRPARTAWRVARRFPRSEAARLEVRPETGRTHQIRVHLAAAGWPVLGDPVYGRRRRAPAGLSRPALHAAVLGFTHPRTGEALRFEAPLPEDLARLERWLEQREGRS